VIANQLRQDLRSMADMKQLFVNGKYVGDYESTGDMRAMARRRLP
jgi:hypothetical protein